jgi:hypothetical protein
MRASLSEATRKRKAEALVTLSGSTSTGAKSENTRREIPLSEITGQDAQINFCPKAIGDWASRIIDPSIIEAKIQKIIHGVSPRITVRIANKHLENLEGVKLAFGFGKCLFDRGGWYSFLFSHPQEIQAFARYMEKHQSLSVKHIRLDLVDTFYTLAAQKPYFPNSDPTLVKAWEKCIRDWYQTDSVTIENF